MISQNIFLYILRHCNCDTYTNLILTNLTFYQWSFTDQPDIPLSIKKYMYISQHKYLYSKAIKNITQNQNITVGQLKLYLETVPDDALVVTNQTGRGWYQDKALDPQNLKYIPNASIMVGGMVLSHEDSQDFSRRLICKENQSVLKI